MCPRVRDIERHSALLPVAFMLFEGGCTEKESRLEVVSDKIEAAAGVELKEAQASLPELPAPPAPPPGLARELWSDLHWLPVGVVGINGTPAGEQPFLAQWVFSQSYAEHESCRSLERGLARGYGIEWEQPPQSFVFYGSADFAQIEECATVFMQALGGTARMKGQVLEISMEGSAGRVVFARRGEELVAIVDDGRIGPVGDARAGRLQENESLVSLLADMKAATLGWSASTRDMTQVPLGVPSRGYTMGVGRPGERWEFRFVFADPAESRRANKAAGPFLKEADAFLGVSLHAQVHEDGNTLAVSFDLTEFFTLEPAKMQALQEKLEEFAAGRQAPGG